MSYESKLLEHLKLNKPIEIPDTFKICDKCGATYPTITLTDVSVPIQVGRPKTE